MIYLVYLIHTHTHERKENINIKISPGVAICAVTISSQTVAKRSDFLGIYQLCLPVSAEGASTPTSSISNGEDTIEANKSHHVTSASFACLCCQLSQVIKQHYLIINQRHSTIITGLAPSSTLFLFLPVIIEASDIQKRDPRNYSNNPQTFIHMWLRKLPVPPLHDHFFVRVNHYRVSTFPVFTSV